MSVAGGLGFLGLAWRLFRSRAGDEPDKAEAVGREAALYDVRAQAKPARDLFAKFDPLLAEREALMRLVRRIATERGIAVLFTEHDMDVVFGVSDRILVLADGKVEASGTHEQLMAQGGRYSELFELQAQGYR